MSPRTIAVPVLAGMGNGLMAQPMVRQLSQTFGGARLCLLARNTSIAGMFDGIAGVDEIRIYGNESRQFARLLRDLRAMRADLCVIPYPSNRWQYSVLANRSRARQVVMHRYGVGFVRAMHFLPGIERIDAIDGRHDVLSNLDLLRPLGIEPDESMAPVLSVSDAERAHAMARLPRDRGERERFCAIHAGSGATIFAMSKRWPAEKFGQLVPRLRSELGLTPILLEGPEDTGVGELIRQHTDIAVLKLTGPPSEAAAVLALCDLYVGSDSGLAHLAAAVGTPPVTLFGPARPDEVCPFGYRHLVVQTPATCAPCFGYPQHATTPAVACRPPYCIGQIEVDEVVRVICDL